MFRHDAQRRLMQRNFETAPVCQRVKSASCDTELNVEPEERDELLEDLYRVINMNMKE